MDDYDLRESGDQSSRASRLTFRPAEIRNPCQNLQASVSRSPTQVSPHQSLLSTALTHCRSVVATLKLQGLKLVLTDRATSARAAFAEYSWTP